jgi:hypothetical protein
LFLLLKPEKGEEEERERTVVRDTAFIRGISYTAVALNIHWQCRLLILVNVLMLETR